MNLMNIARMRAASRHANLWPLAAHRVETILSSSSQPKCLRQFATALRDGPNISGKVLAIRRETFSVWERRAPLSPSHVRKLVRKGVKVLVQPSNRRDYSMQEYTEAGAVIQEDLNEASVIMGVKQIPIDMLIPNRTYCFFSHTIKAQPDNMPLLDAILEKNIRLIDYEKMCDPSGQRVVAFGMFAGVAGMINILNGLGIRLLALGHHTPFMHIGPAHNYRNSEIAKQALRDCGYGISLGRMPKSIGPLTFVFTGSGNVSQGAQNMFAELPHEFIEPEDLPKIATSGATNKVYGCVVSREDHYFRLDGGQFNADEFSKYPQRYGTNFSKTIAPYASVIINGIYWSPNSPRLISIPDAKALLHPEEQPWLTSSPGCPTLPHRLLAICDISADPGGSIEFMTACTTIDKPFCLYDANQNSSQESFAGPGVLVCSIENMPAQLPREATDFFGNLLLPHIPLMLQSDAKQPLEQYRVEDVVRRAVIASNGTLAPDYRYIAELRERKRTSKQFESRSGKRVLVLGSGYVSQPLIDYLSRDKNVNITVGSNVRDELDKILSRETGFDNVVPVVVDVERHTNPSGEGQGAGNTDSMNKLEQLIGQHELVISLLPAALHNQIARMCIARKVNMLTASYSKTLVDAGLDRAAEEAGITMLYEVGLDPGIDHLLAMECFDEVREHGGQVESFTSFCGGLPAPEHANNPLRYKFSWSPRGMLSALKSTAQFLENGHVRQVRGGGVELLSQYCKPLSAYPALNLQYFPNRDSLLYRALYGIDSPACKTCLRGTIRYSGFAESLLTLITCGLLDEKPMPLLHTKGPDLTWRQLMASIFGQNADIHQANLKRIIQERKKLDRQQIELLEQLGLLSDENVVKGNTLLDTLALHLAHKLKFSESERDLTILRHDIGINWGEAARKASGGLEHRAISMVVYGDQPSGGYSAMAKTVGYTAGIAAKMLIDGEIQRKGLVLPLTKEIYRPLLSRLRQEGITYQVDSVMGARSSSMRSVTNAPILMSAAGQEAAAAEQSQR